MLLVTFGVRNQDLKNLTLSIHAVDEWANTNIVPYMDNVSLSWIWLGNEVIPGPNAEYVYGAMNNMYNAIRAVGLVSARVTTVVSPFVLGQSFPPTEVLSKETFPAMNDVAGFLSRTGSPLMVNVYPFFAYVSDPTHISFRVCNIQSGTASNGRKPGVFWRRLLALEKIDAGNVSVAILETGWPSAGKTPYTSKEYAQIYNAKLYSHVLREGTPRWPGNLINTFIFEMSNENKKEAGPLQNFGLFYPHMQPFYSIF